jgi:hypothetical protein
LASILLGGISARLRHYWPQGRELLLVLKLLMLRARQERGCRLMLDHLERLRMKLLMLARLLLIDYLLLYVLILEGTLSSIVRATRGGLLLMKGLGGRQLASIVGRLGEMEGLSDRALRDMVGRGYLLSATVAVLGPVVGASFPLGHLSGLLCSIGSQACQERFHLSHADGMICISSALFGRLKHWVAVTISNDSVTLDTLVALEVAPISVEVPGHLHYGRRETIPHRSVPNLVAG